MCTGPSSIVHRSLSSALPPFTWQRIGRSSAPATPELTRESLRYRRPMPDARRPSRRVFVWLAVWSALLVALFALTSSLHGNAEAQPTRTSGCTPSPCTRGTRVAHTLTSDDGHGHVEAGRRYEVYRPKGLRNSADNKVPALLLFRAGGGTSPPGPEPAYGMEPVADANGFIEIVMF